MIKYSKIIASLAIVFMFSSCNPDDGPKAAKLRDYQTQYNTEKADIEEFLRTHKYSVVDNPGAQDDQDVAFTEVPENDPTSIWNSGELLSRNVTRKDVDYTIYYLKLREGGGADLNDLHAQPSNVDGVLAAYEGRYIARAKVAIEDEGVEIGDLIHRQFEINPFPSTFLSLETVIYGWKEIFPQFRPGDVISIDGQPNLYSDFGAGIMFIPSGLAYYNNAQGAIPTYAPLIFSFKLYDIIRLDQDGDGIPSYLEDLNQDRYIYVDDLGVASPEDDTDGDGIANFMDIDDDNDGTLTKTELRRPRANPSMPFTYYSYNGAVEDDLSTPDIDETQGVPSCGATPDYTTPTRLRRYLDPTCN